MIRNVISVAVFDGRYFAVIKRMPNHQCNGCYFDKRVKCPSVPGLSGWRLACRGIPVTYRLLKDFDVLCMDGKKVMFKKGDNPYDYSLVPIDEKKEQSK